MRNINIARKTNETDTVLFLNLDGTGNAVVDTGIGFLDHMLVLFAKHGRFDLNVKCEGDLDVDCHHTAEDVGILLGQAFNKCFEGFKGLVRYGSSILPMDETLVMTAVDISGRPQLNFDLPLNTQKIGDFDCELVKEFFLAFVRNSGITLHIKKLYGENSHHIIEAAFKSFARALSVAVKIDPLFPEEVLSTKGII